MRKWTENEWRGTKLTCVFDRDYNSDRLRVFFDLDGPLGLPPPPRCHGLPRAQGAGHHAQPGRHQMHLREQPGGASPEQSVSVASYHAGRVAATWGLGHHLRAGHTAQREQLRARQMTAAFRSWWIDALRVTCVQNPNAYENTPLLRELQLLNIGIQSSCNIQSYFFDDFPLPTDRRN